jgi:cell division control protein 11
MTNASFNQIASYIEQQFQDVLREESKLKRNPRFVDNRVHVLIYFIVPTGHGLRETDVEFMKRMASRVNIIPVIAKADSLTSSELAENKRMIMDDIDFYNIPIYHFPSDSESEDESDPFNNKVLRAALPFAIVGSSQRSVINGDQSFVRVYPWGSVNVFDPKISDFGLLREVLLHTHLSDLKENTYDFLYENYRTEQLSQGIESQHSMESNDAHLSHVGAGVGDSDSINTSNSYLQREEQLRQEEERLRQAERRVQEEINQKRQELMRREAELKELEARLQTEALNLNSPSIGSSNRSASNVPASPTVKQEPL